MRQWFRFFFTINAVFLFANALGQISLSHTVTQNYVCNGVGCNYSGPSILINEVMLCPSQFDGSIYGDGPGFTPNTNSGEWIELYNPDYCYPKDISGFLLGNNAPESGINYGGGFVIPPNTIIPSRGFCVIRGVNATPVSSEFLVQNGGNTIEIVVNNTNSCIGGGYRLWFPNSGGWFAFYDKLGNPQDAISWASVSNSCSSCAPCIPPSSSFTGVLPAYDVIPSSKKSYISTNTPTLGLTFRRVPDGGAWQSSVPASPTQGTCNSICVPMPTITCNGTATVVASGGTPPYSYLWSGGSSPINQLDSGLCSGTYTVTVTDLMGVSATTSVFVPNWVPNSSFTINPDTFCANNSAIVNYTGDASSLSSFEWTTTDATLNSGIGIGPHSVSSSVSGLHPLSLVVSQNGCQSLPTVHSFYLYTIGASISLINIPICYQTSTGALTASGENGVEPYSYQWNNGITMDNNNNLSAGIYSVTVTDFLGCTASNTYSMQDQAPIITNVDVVSESCKNACNGIATLITSGLTPPYTFQWLQNSSISSVASEYCGGDYHVMVTDSNNCSQTAQFSITTAYDVTSLASSNPSVGIAPLDVSFYYIGIGATTFFWDFGDGSNSTFINPVHTYTNQGVYAVTLIVSTGAPSFCTDSTTIKVEVLPPSNVEIPNVFTPNGDSFNDSFFAVSVGIALESMKIYNRWGREVFVSNSISEPWYGIDKDGLELSEGVYYYVYVAKGYDNKEYNLHGSVSLLR